MTDCAAAAITTNLAPAVLLASPSMYRQASVSSSQNNRRRGVPPILPNNLCFVQHNIPKIKRSFSPNSFSCLAEGFVTSTSVLCSLKTQLSGRRTCFFVVPVGLKYILHIVSYILHPPFSFKDSTASFTLQFIFE